VLLAPARSDLEVRVPCTFPKVERTTLRFELLEQPSGKLLYVTSGEYDISKPLDIGLVATLSYLNEETLAGSWKVGLAPEALAASEVLLSVMEGERRTPVSLEIAPKRASGSFVLDVSKLPAGRYTLRGELLLGKKRIADKEIGIERIAGPFSRD